jgi:hypothetical protein
MPLFFIVAGCHQSSIFLHTQSLSDIHPYKTESTIPIHTINRLQRKREADFYRAILRRSRQGRDWQ